MSHSSPASYHLCALPESTLVPEYTQWPTLGRKNTGKPTSPDFEVIPLTRQHSDKVLGTPEAPLTAHNASWPLEEFGKQWTEKDLVEDYFADLMTKPGAGLSAGWKVKYRMSVVHAQNAFLCTNWAFARLDGRLQDGKEFKEAPHDIDNYTPDQFVGVLEKNHGVVRCGNDDPKAVRSSLPQSLGDSLMMAADRHRVEDG